LCLRACTTAQCARAQTATVRAGTIPLGKTAPGGGAEDFNAHSSSDSELGVGVRADFAVQVDLFVLRGGPFHEESSFGIRFQITQKDYHKSLTEGMAKFEETSICAEPHTERVLVIKNRPTKASDFSETKPQPVVVKKGPNRNTRFPQLFSKKRMFSLDKGQNQPMMWRKVG